MKFSGRLKKLIIRYFDDNKKRFSLEAKIPYSSVVEYTTGIKENPTLEFINKCLAVFPENVNTIWFLSGRGEMELNLANIPPPKGAYTAINGSKEMLPPSISHENDQSFDQTLTKDVRKNVRNVSGNDILEKELKAAKDHLKTKEKLISSLEKQVEMLEGQLLDYKDRTKHSESLKATTALTSAPKS